MFPLVSGIAEHLKDGSLAPQPASGAQKPSVVEPPGDGMRSELFDRAPLENFLDRLFLLRIAGLLKARAVGLTLVDVAVAKRRRSVGELAFLQLFAGAALGI